MGDFTCTSTLSTDCRFNFDSFCHSKIYRPGNRPNDPKHAEGPLDVFFEARNAEKVRDSGIGESESMRRVERTKNMPRYPPLLDTYLDP